MWENLTQHPGAVERSRGSVPLPAAAVWKVCSGVLCILVFSEKPGAHAFYKFYDLWKLATNSIFVRLFEVLFGPLCGEPDKIHLWVIGLWLLVLYTEGMTKIWKMGVFWKGLRKRNHSFSHRLCSCNWYQSWELGKMTLLKFSSWFWSLGSLKAWHWHPVRVSFCAVTWQRASHSDTEPAYNRDSSCI